MKPSTPKQKMPTNMKSVRKKVREFQIRNPMPSWAAIASAATITRKAFASARRIPTKIDGNVAGNATFRNTSRRLAPSVWALLTLSGCTEEAPVAVVISTTNSAA